MNPNRNFKFIIHNNNNPKQKNNVKNFEDIFCTLVFPFKSIVQILMLVSTWLAHEALLCNAAFHLTLPCTQNEEDNFCILLLTQPISLLEFIKKNKKINYK